MPRGKAGLPDRQLLEAALEGLQLQRQRLEEQISQVRGMLGGASATAAPAKKRGRRPKNAVAVEAAPAPTKRRRLSTAARKRIAAAQKKRWAEYRKTEKAGESK